MRVNTMEYSVTDTTSAILAGRRWLWIARVVARVASLLCDLDTSVLEGRAMQGLTSFSNGATLGSCPQLIRMCTRE
jgi:hypothetical protein